MPSTVIELLNRSNLELAGKVKWGERVSKNAQGIYLVSLSNNPRENDGISNKAPVDVTKVSFWINKVHSIELDGVRNPPAEKMVERLSRFWLPDENILYIGRTTQPLSKRVRQYYYTKLGNQGPHAGGHWLKTLSNLDDLYVYYAVCSTPKDKEDELLGSFIDNVSDATKTILLDPIRPFPFANLEYPRGTRKKHGIGKSTL